MASNPRATQRQARRQPDSYESFKEAVQGKKFLEDLDDINLVLPDTPDLATMLAQGIPSATRPSSVLEFCEDTTDYSIQRRFYHFKLTFHVEITEQWQFSGITAFNSGSGVPIVEAMALQDAEPPQGFVHSLLHTLSLQYAMDPASSLCQVVLEGSFKRHVTGLSFCIFSPVTGKVSVSTTFMFPPVRKAQYNAPIVVTFPAFA